jgi:hypothetical protein
MDVYPIPKDGCRIKLWAFLLFDDVFSLLLLFNLIICNNGGDCTICVIRVQSQCLSFLLFTSRSKKRLHSQRASRKVDYRGWLRLQKINSLRVWSVLVKTDLLILSATVSAVNASGLVGIVHFFKGNWRCSWSERKIGYHAPADAIFAHHIKTVSKGVISRCFCE